MVAGTLAASGYYLGGTLLPPTDANPRGYFESREVEHLNEILVATMLYPSWRERALGWLRPIPVQPDFTALPISSRARWLALIPTWRRPFMRPDYAERMRTLVSHQPYCFKDPRFSYTLTAWRPYLQNTAFVCVFRDPGVTARSIVKEVQNAEYLKGLDVDFGRALEVWRWVYQHVLQVHRHEGDWLFLHYDQVLSGDGLDRLQRHLDAPVDRGFVDARLRRTCSQDAVPVEVRRLYAELCRLAEYEPPPAAAAPEAVGGSR